MGRGKRPLFLFTSHRAPRFHFPPLLSLPTTQQHDYNIYSIAKAIHNQS